MSLYRPLRNSVVSTVSYVTFSLINTMGMSDLKIGYTDLANVCAE